MRLSWNTVNWREFDIRHDTSWLTLEREILKSKQLINNNIHYFDICFDIMNTVIYLPSS